MNDKRMNLGVVIFVLAAGIPGLHLSGFHNWGSEIPDHLFYIVAAIGGAVAGLLIGRASPIGGLIGGAVAGVCGLAAIAMASKGEARMSKFVLIAIQGVASLPGVAIYFLVKKVMGSGKPAKA